MYYVMCQVSGGVTGNRTAPLKGSNHQVRYFETHDAAQTEADRLTTQMNSQHRTATFQYWPKEV